MHRYTPQEIIQHYELIVKKSNATQLEIAKQLSISEAELITAHSHHLSNDQRLYSQKIKPNWHEFFSELSELGTVLAVTRNEACVHEYKTSYHNIEAQAYFLRVEQKSFQLSLDYDDLDQGFFVIETTEKETKRSIQLFNRDGHSIHKIYCQAQSDTAAFDQLLKRYSYTKTVDHDFYSTSNTILFGMPTSLHPSLEDLESYIEVKAPHYLHEVIEQIRTSRLSVVIQVNSPSCQQRYIGPIHNMATMDTWVTIMDPLFNLHIQMDLIKETVRLSKRHIDKESCDQLFLLDKKQMVVLHLSLTNTHDETQREIWHNLLDGLTVRETL